MIGSKTSDRVFELAVQQQKRVLSVKSSFKSLWHQRMGHFSDLVFQNHYYMGKEFIVMVLLLKMTVNRILSASLLESQKTHIQKNKK